MDSKKCLQCNSEFLVNRSRRDTAKFCSARCANNNKKKKPNTSCRSCGKALYLKPSRMNKLKWGAHCSVACLAKTKADAYLGESNPNYKGVRQDSDGYAYTYSDGNAKTLLNKTDENKLHRAVCAESLGVRKLSSGFHVHHRDCDSKNNDIDNLAVMCISDHKWIHKQFGNACLWAFMRGLVDIEDLCKWSNDKDRARRLLNLKVSDQDARDLV